MDFDSGIFERTKKSYARIVNPHIDATKRVHGLTSESGDRVGVTHIGRDDQGMGTDRGALGRDIVKCRLIAGGEHEPRSAFREGVRRGAPNPAGGASNDDDVVVKCVTARGRLGRRRAHSQKIPSERKSSVGYLPKSHWGKERPERWPHELRIKAAGHRRRATKVEQVCDLLVW